MLITHHLTSLSFFSFGEMSNRQAATKRDDNARILHLLGRIGSRKVFEFSLERVMKHFVEFSLCGRRGRRILPIRSLVFERSGPRKKRYRRSTDRPKSKHPHQCQFEFNCTEEDESLLRGTSRNFIDVTVKVHVPLFFFFASILVTHLRAAPEKLETMTMTMMKFVECWKIIYMFSNFSTFPFLPPLVSLWKSSY